MLITAEHPEIDPRHIVRAVVRRGLVPVPPKVLVSLRIDQDVLDWYKAQGAGYQTRMNAVLRAFRDASNDPVPSQEPPRPRSVRK